MTAHQETVQARYAEFVDKKTQLGGEHGFAPLSLPSQMFDFQASVTEWAIRKGRAALLLDCGLGKSLCQLAWADNIVRKTNGRVLVLTPLAVAHQTVLEGEKFGIEVRRSHHGEIEGAGIYVANYERLHHFDRSQFDGCVCDESGCLKNFDGITKDAITEFMRKMKYRLLCSATPSPNDYIELGTHSEALGDLGFIDMTNRFFKKNAATSTRSDELRSGLYRFRGHSEHEFWRWVCSWARAARKPSDLGFDDALFQLPPLNMSQHTIKARNPNPEMLFEMPAHGLKEQRSERRRTVQERCEKVAELLQSEQCAVSWCALNDEGDLMEKLIAGAVQVSGSQSDEEKEEAFRAFEGGEIRVLVTKPAIAGWGLNWFHCSRSTFFPSHSFEQLYQSIRRFWRFGQKNPVQVDIITSEGEASVMANLQRKAEQAEVMFSNLVRLMNDELKITQANNHIKKGTMPKWI